MASLCSVLVGAARSGPVQFEVELARYRATPELLLADIQDVTAPEIRAACEMLTSDEQRLKLAAQRSGDLGNLNDGSQGLEVPTLRTPRQRIPTGRTRRGTGGLCRPSVIALRRGAGQRARDRPDADTEVGAPRQ